MVQSKVGETPLVRADTCRLSKGKKNHMEVQNKLVVYLQFGDRDQLG